MPTLRLVKVAPQRLSSSLQTAARLHQTSNDRDQVASDN
jgi:hypothetical protein